MKSRLCVIFAINYFLKRSIFIVIHVIIQTTILSNAIFAPSHIVKGVLFLGMKNLTNEKHLQCFFSSKYFFHKSNLSLQKYVNTNQKHFSECPS